MAYGLQVYRSDGALVLDISSRLTRNVTSFNVALNNSGQGVSVPGITADGTWLAFPSHTYATVRIFDGYVYVELIGMNATFTVNILRV
jgi:hypothetical protein